MTKSGIFGLLVLALAATPALGQSTAQFVAAFSGQWIDYDAGLATGKQMCSLDLSGGNGTQLPVKPVGCAAPLAAAVSWSIDKGQLVLADQHGTALARLGGNQQRITGSAADGSPLILERRGGNGDASALMATYNASGCYYLGYTQKCAPPAELGKPVAGVNGKIQVDTDVDVDVRSEPRSDANTVGVVKQGNCVQIDRCVMASDGPWCEAHFGTAAGWLRKLAIRQNRWPVVTFSNECS